MADNTREILRAVEDNLIRIPGDDKMESPIVKDKIPAVMCDFAASVEKLRELQPMISQGGLTEKEQADAFVATKCVVITIEKFSEGTFEDRISDHVLTPGSLSGFLTELGISGIVDYTLNDLFPNGETEKLENNPYLDKNTLERLEITYNDYGASGDIVDIEGPADRNYTTIHTAEERDRILVNDDGGEITSVEKGTDGRGHEHVDIRTCPPEQNTFLSIIDPADKKDLWERYKGGEDVQIVARAKDLEWEKGQYKEVIDRVISEATDGEKGDAYAEAARLYGLGGFDDETVHEAHANAAIEYDKESDIEGAYRESLLAGDKLPAETKSELLDNAIRFECYNVIGDSDLSNEDKDKMNNTVNFSIDDKDPAAVREEFESRGIAVPDRLEQLLENKEIEIGVREPEAKVEASENDSKDDTSANDSAPAAVAAPVDRSTASDTEKPGNAGEAAVDQQENTTGPAAVTSEDNTTKNKPPLEGYVFTAKDAVSPDDLEKSANTFIDLFKDESIEKEIRDKLGDEKANHYKELLVDLAGAVATISAGNDTEELREKIDGIANEIMDICRSVPSDPVDTGTERKENAQDAKDRELLDKLTDLGKKAYIDPHTNRAVHYRSNNPYQLGATLDYCLFVKQMDNDDFKRITGNDKPQNLNTAIAFNAVNYIRSWSLSNVSAAYSEALYQAFNKDTEKNPDPSLEKAKEVVFEKHNVSCLAGVIKDRDNEYTKELVEKLGEDKYQQLTNSLDKYLDSGDRSGLREANNIIDHADRSVGGMNRSERFDRRDIFSNIDILNRALDARRNGDKIDLQIPGKDVEKGTTVSRFDIFMLFTNLVLNSDIVYSVGKVAFESIRDNFISYYDEKNKKAADILKDVLKENNMEKEPADRVSKEENNSGVIDKPEGEPNEVDKNENNRDPVDADTVEGQKEDTPDEAGSGDATSIEDHKEDAAVETGNSDAATVEGQKEDTPVEAGSEAAATVESQAKDTPVETGSEDSVTVEDQDKEAPVEIGNEEPATIENKNVDTPVETGSEDSATVEGQDEDAPVETGNEDSATLENQDKNSSVESGNNDAATVEGQKEDTPVENESRDSATVEGTKEDVDPVDGKDENKKEENTAVTVAVPVEVSSGDVVTADNKENLEDKTEATSEKESTDEEKIDKAKSVDAEWYEGKELSAEDIADLKEGAFAVIDNAEEKTGKELGDAAGWLQIARDSGGNVDKADISRAHMASCEAYRKEGNTTNAFKEALRVGGPVSYDTDNSRFQAIKDYANDCVSKAKASEGGYGGTYLRAARVISLVPGLSNDFDKSVFEKAISEIQSNEDLCTAKDFELASKWADELGYNANDVEALKEKADEKRFEEHPHDVIVIPAVQDRIEQSGDNKIDFGELYKEIKADVEAKLGHEYTERHFAEDVSVIIDDLNDRGEMNPDQLDKATEEFMDYENIDVEIRDLVDEDSDNVETSNED